jgi:uncharacterized membrane protein YGL010W
VAISRAELEQMFVEYDRDHQHPTNRALHIIGITLIGSGVAIVWFAPLPGTLAIASGWAAQLIGHELEGNRPSFTRRSGFMAVGAVWYVRTIKALLRRRRQVPAPGGV